MDHSVVHPRRFSLPVKGVESMFGHIEQRVAKQLGATAPFTSRLAE